MLFSNMLLAMLMHAKQSAVHSQSRVSSCLLLRVMPLGLRQAMTRLHVMQYRWLSRCSSAGSSLCSWRTEKRDK